MLKEAGSDFLEDKAPRLGAALAYYTVFSLAPLLVIVIAIAGVFFGRAAVQGHIARQFRDLVGDEGARAVQAMIVNADRPGAGLVAGIVGVVMLLVGATGLFGQLQDALNTIWEVEPRPGRGVWGLIRDRLLSFSMVLGTTFLLLVSLVVSTALAALGNFVGGEAASALGQVVHFGVSFAVITLLFAMIYRYLPDAKIAWQDVWFGALTTALLFSVGKVGLGLYLGRGSVGSAYGAAGSLAVLLIWIYYSSQIFLFGGELTKAFAQLSGKPIEPTANARRVSEEQREEEGIPHNA